MKRTPIPQIKRILEAIRENTFLKKISLANMGLYDMDVAPLIDVIEDNETLRAVNVETNYLSGEFFARLLRAALKNQSLEEIKGVNQGVSFSTTAEREIIDAVFQNRGLTKVSINLRLPEGRHKIEQATIRNQEIRRILRRQASEAARAAEATEAAKVAAAADISPGRISTVGRPFTKKQTMATTATESGPSTSKMTLTKPMINPQNIGDAPKPAIGKPVLRRLNNSAHAANESDETHLLSTSVPPMILSQINNVGNEEERTARAWQAAASANGCTHTGYDDGNDDKTNRLSMKAKPMVRKLSNDVESMYAKKDDNEGKVAYIPEAPVGRASLIAKKFEKKEASARRDAERSVRRFSTTKKPSDCQFNVAAVASKSIETTVANASRDESLPSKYTNGIECKLTNNPCKVKFEADEPKSISKWRQRKNEETRQNINEFTQEELSECVGKVNDKEQKVISPYIQRRVINSKADTVEKKTISPYAKKILIKEETDTTKQEVFSSRAEPEGANAKTKSDEKQTAASPRVKKRVVNADAVEPKTSSPCAQPEDVNVKTKSDEQQTAALPRVKKRIVYSDAVELKTFKPEVIGQKIDTTYRYSNKTDEKDEPLDSKKHINESTVPINQERLFNSLEKSLHNPSDMKAKTKLYNTTLQQPPPWRSKATSRNETQETGAGLKRREFEQHKHFYRVYEDNQNINTKEDRSRDAGSITRQYSNETNRNTPSNKNRVNADDKLHGSDHNLTLFQTQPSTSSAIETDHAMPKTPQTPTTTENNAATKNQSKTPRKKRTKAINDGTTAVQLQSKVITNLDVVNKSSDVITKVQTTNDKVNQKDLPTETLESTVEPKSSACEPLTTRPKRVYDDLKRKKKSTVEENYTKLSEVSTNIQSNSRLNRPETTRSDVNHDMLKMPDTKIGEAKRHTNSELNSRLTKPEENCDGLSRSARLRREDIDAKTKTEFSLRKSGNLEKDNDSMRYTNARNIEANDNSKLSHLNTSDTAYVPLTTRPHKSAILKREAINGNL